MIGGTASVITGGKFGNGAMSAAFVYLFNDNMHKKRNKTKAIYGRLKRKYKHVEIFNMSDKITYVIASERGGFLARSRCLS